MTLFAGFLIAEVGGEQEIRKAEKSWVAAVTARDYTALERILQDKLIYAHSTGAIESKSDYIGRLRSGVQRYDAIEYQNTTVRSHGDAAVAHSIVRMKGESNGRPFNNKLMMIHLWVKQGGQWQLAAHQTTEVP
jgi:ketosteroid isomerase-like protein